MNNSPEISVVVPVYNEEACLSNLFYRLVAVMENTERTYELIFVNDGSIDGTGKLLSDFHDDHPDKVTIVEFNGNYGQFTAICAGFERVRGMIVVTLDADLQNPPEEIPKLLKKMEEGYDYVGGVRKKRRDSFMRRWCSKIVNGIREKTTGIHITDQGCMLRAYSRPIVDAVARAEEKSVFISALAYKYASAPGEVDVAHDERSAGKSRYSYFGLIRLNFDLFTGFTMLPLQLMTLAGMLLSAASLLAFTVFVILIIWLDAYITQVFLFISGLLFLAGILITGIGLIGEYVGRIYQAVLKRPNYLVKHVAEAGRSNEMNIRAVK